VPELVTEIVPKIVSDKRKVPKRSAVRIGCGVLNEFVPRRFALLNAVDGAGRHRRECCAARSLFPGRTRGQNVFRARNSVLRVWGGSIPRPLSLYIYLSLTRNTELAIPDFLLQWPLFFNNLQGLNSVLIPCARNTNSDPKTVENLFRAKTGCTECTEFKSEDFRDSSDPKGRAMEPVHASPARFQSASGFRCF
jgi:hypothetical protein